MLSKSQRMTQNEFDSVYDDGQSVSGSVGYIKFIEFNGKSKFSCVAPKNEVAQSTTRNQIRRRGYATLEEILDCIPEGYRIIWFLPASAEEIEFSELKKGIRKVLKKADIIES